MTEKQWYEDIPRDEIASKHVRAVMDSGAVIEGCLKYWDSRLVTVYMGSMVEGIYVLGSIDNRWNLMKGVKSLDLVWDERDWYRIDTEDVLHGDAVVVNGQLCTVDKPWPGDYCLQVVAYGPGRMLIDLNLIPYALRRKVQVPVKPGFYKDTMGEFWARSSKPTDGVPWQAVEPDALDQPARSDKYMANLMPLTPVHFESGRAA